MEPYTWPAVSRFVNRHDDLARLNAWWDDDTRDALALIGRRRVGKSWLFRRFADQKPALIFVADTRLPSHQMARFGAQLERYMPARPALPSVAEFIRVLYRLGERERLLAVIDEFPSLLPDGRARDHVLSELQVVMEEHRDASQTRLMLCGSVIGQMESLLNANSPLHGRLIRLDVQPLTFAESRAMTPLSDTPEERIARYAVTGGMARYLSQLGRSPLAEAVCTSVLNTAGPLFDDVRVVLGQELRNPALYFSILEALAHGPTTTEKLSSRLGLRSSALTPYLETLRSLRLISSHVPIGSPRTARSQEHQVSDGFVRFWFRFVFPNQDALQQGLAPEDLWNGEIAPYLADFVASAFEQLCLRYTLRTRGARAQQVGRWWGPALNASRRARTRLSEEIDVVGAHRQSLILIGECKWTSKPLDKPVLDELFEHKLPALLQQGRLKAPSTELEVLLFSRSGFADTLQATARTDPSIKLIGLDELVTQLDLEDPHDSSR